jgi:hypothetical protein
MLGQPSVLSAPAVGGDHAGLDRDILLVQAKFEPTPAQVVAEGDWLLGELL